ncbi:MAG: hypothetical protein CMQ43_13235 [Gammaproteobacteria bacterium]|nr:hypothetical protein [Gammaproteobacteria bacterium]MBK81866.1 hypothetical protein [Gammaproteobacteria bacterium]
MLRIRVAPQSSDRWSGFIERQFNLTLASLSPRLVEVELRTPTGGAVRADYECRLVGRAAGGHDVRVVSRHERGEQAIAHAFARARRELRRERLRAPAAG